MKIVKLISLTLTLCILFGCNTQYDDFKHQIKEGIDSEVVKNYLNSNKISYHFLTCSEIEDRVDSSRVKCRNHRSKGIFQGLVNDGAYMLGMGSSDIQFYIEIGSDSKVLKTHLNRVYTFL